MGILSIGCVLSIDIKDDCQILKVDDGFLNVNTLVIKPPVYHKVKVGDCIVYTTDSDNKRIMHLGIINDVNMEILTQLEIMKAEKQRRKSTMDLL